MAGETEFKAPAGKTRVIGVDLFDHGDYLVGDYDTLDKAVEVVDKKNKARKGSIDDIYYAYDEHGKNVRANQAGSQKVSP